MWLSNHASVEIHFIYLFILLENMSIWVMSIWVIFKHYEYLGYL